MERARRLVLRQGPLSAYWRGPGPVPAHGTLSADGHGDVPEQVPPVQGSVVVVVVVEQAYRLSGPRTYVPVPGDFWMRPVCPGARSGSTPSPRDDEHRRDPVRQDSGVLVRLSVERARADTPVRPPFYAEVLGMRVNEADDDW